MFSRVKSGTDMVSSEADDVMFLKLLLWTRSIRPKIRNFPLSNGTRPMSTKRLQFYILLIVNVLPYTIYTTLCLK